VETALDNARQIAGALGAREGDWAARLQCKR
jgi:hypothetical protein